MNEELYHRALMHMAAAAHGAGRLPAPDATATVHNPLCGDRITIDIKLVDGRFSALGHDARACVICQAAASLLAQQIIAKNKNEFRALFGQVAKTLQHPGSSPPAFEIFEPIAPHKNRHRCVLLPFEAVEKALNSCALRES